MRSLCSCSYGVRVTLLVYLYKTFCSEQYTLKDEINPIRFCLYQTFLFDVWCNINSDSRPRNFKSWLAGNSFCRHVSDVFPEDNSPLTLTSFLHENALLLP